MSAAQRVARFGEIIRERSEDIYREGGLNADLWEALTQEEVLGLIAPTAAVARAIAAQIWGLDDDLLKEIIVEGILRADNKEKINRRNPVKTWPQLLKEECSRKQPGSIRNEESNEETVSERSKREETSTMARPKVEFKLESYDGAEDKCSLWICELERQMKRMRLPEDDYLTYTINATTGKAKSAITINIG